MERDPELVERIEGISLMGGSAGAGNVTAVAEFNIWADPEAAEIVMACGAHIRMSGLNLTRQWQSDDTVAARLKESGSVKAQVAAAILDDIHDRMESLGRGRRAALHDPCAVLAVTHPELVGFEERHVTVETAGVYTRGMTVVDERPTPGILAANIEVGYQIDSKSAMELLLGAFEGA
jgi:inosine-uridine nucleoside N-ribohydrolase